MEASEENVKGGGRGNRRKFRRSTKDREVFFRESLASYTVRDSARLLSYSVLRNKKEKKKKKKERNETSETIKKFERSSS